MSGLAMHLSVLLQTSFQLDRLITDLAWREKLKQKMASVLSRALNDVAPIRAMEQHLLAACQVNSK